MSRERHFFAAFVLCCLLLGTVGEAQPKPIRRVLIFYEVGTTYPGIRLIDRGIRAALHTSPYQLEVYREYMDTILFPDPADQRRFRDSYIRKYQNRRPDVIITVGPSPLNFMLETHRTAFPGVPIVFCLPDWAAGRTPVLDSDFTGVEDEVFSAETVEAALRLQPGTRDIIVVGGTSFYDTKYTAIAREKLKPYEGNLDVSYLTTLTMPDLLQRLKHLPRARLSSLLVLAKTQPERSLLAQNRALLLQLPRMPQFLAYLMSTLVMAKLEENSLFCSNTAGLLEDSRSGFSKGKNHNKSQESKLQTAIPSIGGPLSVGA